MRTVALEKKQPLRTSLESAACSTIKVLPFANTTLTAMWHSMLTRARLPAQIASNSSSHWATQPQSQRTHLNNKWHHITALRELHADLKRTCKAHQQTGPQLGPVAGCLLQRPTPSIGGGTAPNRLGSSESRDMLAGTLGLKLCALGPRTCRDESLRRVRLS